MNKKKVLIFSREFPPFLGGAGTVAFEYAKTLGEYFDVTVITEKRLKSQLLKNNEGLKFDIKEIRSYFYLPSVLRFLKFRDYAKFDLIILNDSSSIFFAGIFFSRKLLSKCICLYHGSEPERIYENPTKIRRLVNYKYFFTRATKLSRKNFAVSKYMSRKMSGIKDLRDVSFEVLYTPISQTCEEQSAYLSFEHQQLFDSLKDKDIYITASRIVEKKGHKYLLDGFEKALADKSDCWHWVIVGDGPYLETLKRMVELSPISDYVSFLGGVSRSYLSTIYSHSDCMVLLSDYKESFGLVYLEANLQGIPAVGFKRYGVVEAISHGKSGFLVNSVQDFKEIVTTSRFDGLEEKNILSHAHSFSSKRLVKCITGLLN